MENSRISVGLESAHPDTFSTQKLSFLSQGE